MKYYRTMICDMTTVSNSVWYDGFRAFLHGKPDTDNPHGFQTPPYYQWANGWHESRKAWIEHKSESSNPHRPENRPEP
jgi:hypothetical protein